MTIYNEIDQYWNTFPAYVNIFLIFLGFVVAAIVDKVLLHSNKSKPITVPAGHIMCTNTELEKTKSNHYQRGKKDGYATGLDEGYRNGFDKGSEAGYHKGRESGASDLKEKYVAFMQETMLMVMNDEMELITVTTEGE